MISTMKPSICSFYGSFTSDENSPECITRICNIRMVRILIPKQLCRNTCKEVYIALSIRDDKHPLRSSPITLAGESGDFFQADMDFNFSLRYCHFIRRKFNLLKISLQRRRTYNNKVVAGYKTIALHILDLSWIVQKSDPDQLLLSTKTQKDLKVVVSINGLNSLPHIPEKISNTNKKTIYSSQDAAISSQSASDGEASPKVKRSIKKSHMPVEEQRKLTKVLGTLTITDKVRESILSLANTQPNLEHDSDVESFESCSSFEDIDFYKTDLTIKPTIRPYFQDRINSSSTASSESFTQTNPDIRPQDTSALNTSVNQQINALSSEHVTQPSTPLRAYNSQDSPVFDFNNYISDDAYLTYIRNSTTENMSPNLPDSKCYNSYFIVMLHDTYSDKTKFKLLQQKIGSKFIMLRDKSAIKLFLTIVLSRIQNQIDSSLSIPVVKICIVGREECLTSYLQELVQFNMPRLSEIMLKLQILYAPIGIGRISAYFANINKIYSTLFNDTKWTSVSSDTENFDAIEMVTRIYSFVHACCITISLPLSEVSLKLSEFASFEEFNTGQISIPFLKEVIVGFVSNASENSDSLELNDIFSKTSLSNSPVTKEAKKSKRRSVLLTRPLNMVDDRLVIDYWVGSTDENPKDADKAIKGDKKEVKLSRKSGAYQVAIIYRNDFSGEMTRATEYLNIDIRKAKAFLIGDTKLKGKKKEDSNQVKIMNVQRLLCSSKAASFDVNIDGKIWEGVKYFSATPTWGANLKTVPFALPSTIA